MQQEVISIRAEVDDIWRRVALIKEANELHKELAVIQKEVVRIQDQAKQSLVEADKAKQGRENQERERVEKEKKEREELEKKEREQRERREREERERKEREEREKKELEQRERERREREERERREREEKERREREEQERREKEKRDQEEKAKQAAKPAVQAPVKTSVPATKQTTQSYLTVGKNVPLDSTDKYLDEKKRLESQERDAVFGARTRVVEKPEFQQFGIDQDIRQRMANKYDPNLEREAKDWIENVTGQKLEGSFASALKSGVVLCNLVNKIKPNTIKKVNTARMPFMQMENIKFFLDAAKSLGVPEPDLFMTVDLFEEKNLNQVVQTVHSLGRASQKVSGYSGPTIGAKLASKNERDFTEEQLRKGQTELTYAQTNQKETQKIVSEMRKPGLDTVVKSTSGGTATAEVGLLDKGKSEAQKEVNSAKRVGHNIIK